MEYEKEIVLDEEGHLRAYVNYQMFGIPWNPSIPNRVRRMTRIRL